MMFAQREIKLLRKRIEEMDETIREQNILLGVASNLEKIQKQHIDRLKALLNLTLDKGKFGKGIEQSLRHEFEQIFNPETWYED